MVLYSVQYYLYSSGNGGLIMNACVYLNEGTASNRDIFGYFNEDSPILQRAEAEESARVPLIKNSAVNRSTEYIIK